MTKKILAYIDHFQGSVQPSSWEGVGLAACFAEESGGEAAALVLGDGVSGLAETAVHCGASQVFVGDHELLGDFRPEPLADLVAKAARIFEPDLILFPATSRGRSLAAMASVDLETGVMVDVIQLDWEGEQLTATRPIYAGKLLAQLQCSAKPQIVTFRVRAFDKPEPDSSLTGTITDLELDLDPGQITTEVKGYHKKDSGVSLSDASVIVSGGRGVSLNTSLEPPGDLDDEAAEIWKAEQGFGLIEELAAVLNAAVGASRAAVDAKYIDYDHQVGQTGKVVSPDLYIACGVSGAIQHLAGMRSSKVIVAINKDPDAPIFNYARFGVVGDMHAVLPPLTAALRDYLGA